MIHRAPHQTALFSYGYESWRH